MDDDDFEARLTRVERMLDEFLESDRSIKDGLEEVKRGYDQLRMAIEQSASAQTAYQVAQVAMIKSLMSSSKTYSEKFLRELDELGKPLQPGIDADEISIQLAAIRQSIGGAAPARGPTVREILAHLWRWKR